MFNLGEGFVAASRFLLTLGSNDPYKVGALYPSTMNPYMAI